MLAPVADSTMVYTSVPSGNDCFKLVELALLRAGGTIASLDVVAMVGAVSASPFIKLDWLP